MLIYDSATIRVVQHLYLSLFNIEVWLDGDWQVHTQVHTIAEVRSAVAKLTTLTT
jgi:hypothetical protein